MNQADSLENAIDAMREKYRDDHIQRLRSDECGIDQGLVYVNLLTNLEKIGDYCLQHCRGGGGQKIERVRKNPLSALIQGRIHFFDGIPRRKTESIQNRKGAVPGRWPGAFLTSVFLTRYRFKKLLWNTNRGTGQCCRQP
jgi:hypothetical protein